MKRTRTALDYADRIQRVVEHIAAHLDETLDLERLAEVACFSPYHFHRIYRGLQGETPDQTVRRFRLHRAAVALARSEAPLARVAARAGYGSPEAFARAFASAYGLPPAAYRAERGSPELYPWRRDPVENAMYDVTILTAPAYRLIGLRHAGDYDAIGGSFDKLAAWAGSRGLIGPDSQMVGVYYDDPDTVPAAELRSVAGVAIGPDIAPEPPFEIVELPEGPVARLIHKGPYAELKTAYRHLYATWLPGSGREPADRPCFEVYLNDPRSVPASDLMTEVCLPLAD